MATSAIINVMRMAAQKASRGLLRDFGEVENLQITRKGVSDFVTRADTDAEAILTAELARARPGWGFLAEEGGGQNPADGNGGGNTDGGDGDEKAPRWIIDPLDGTTNFIHGIPHFAISIAAEEGGKIIAGAILDPIRHEFFFAEPGKGAFLNERRIRVSGRHSLHDSVIACGIPHRGRGSADDHAGFGRELAIMMENTAGIRRAGAAALDLAWLAAGRVDGFWERNLSLWDVAAGMLIVKEAGGLISDMRARPVSLAEPHPVHIAAGNAHSHGALLRMLKAAHAQKQEA